jgi:hypothetical protein
VLPVVAPKVDAAAFGCGKGEREMLPEAVPEPFRLHPHWAAHGLVLVRAGRREEGRARARLLRHWREGAPKRWPKARGTARGTG